MSRMDAFIQEKKKPVQNEVFKMHKKLDLQEYYSIFFS